MTEKKTESDTEEKKSNKKKRPGKNDEGSKDIEISKDKDDGNNAKILENLEGIHPGLKEFSRSMLQFSGTIPHPFASKLTESHIDKIIEISAKDDERRYDDTQQARKFTLTYILLGISLFVFLALFLVGKDTELFKEIIKIFATFVGGMGAGYAIKSHMDKDD